MSESRNIWILCVSVDAVLPTLFYDGARDLSCADLLRRPHKLQFPRFPEEAPSTTERFCVIPQGALGLGTHAQNQNVKKMIQKFPQLSGTV